MADERDQQLPRGITVSRRREAPPWRAEVDARAGASIHVVVRGSFHLAAEGRRGIELEPGDIVLLGAGRQGAGAGAHVLQCVDAPDGAQPEPAELLSAAYALPAAPDRRLAALAPVVHLPANDVRRERGLAAIVGLLRAALADPSAGQEQLARSLLDPLFAYVLHACERARAGALGGHPAQPADERVARAIRRLRAQPAERWTVASLAKAAGLSRAAFARRFLAEIGVPPLRYLADLRMHLAARLLTEGDASLASIAAQVGYESEFAFSRAFKRRTGEAPGVYRRRHRAVGAPFCRASLRAVA